MTASRVTEVMQHGAKARPEVLIIKKKKKKNLNSWL